MAKRNFERIREQALQQLADMRDPEAAQRRRAAEERVARQRDALDRELTSHARTDGVITDNFRKALNNAGFSDRDIQDSLEINAGHRQAYNAVKNELDRRRQMQASMGARERATRTQGIFQNARKVMGGAGG